MPDYLSYAQQLNPLGQFRAGEQLVDSAFQTQRLRQAGQAYAGGNRQGAADILAAGGDLENAASLEHQIQQDNRQSSADQAKVAAQKAETLLNITRGLRQVPAEQRKAKLSELQPMLAQVVSPDVMAQIANADLSDQSLDAFSAALGQEAQKYTFINAGEQGIYRGDPRSGAVEQVVAGHIPDPKPVEVGNGGTLVDPKTGKVIYTSPKTFAPARGRSGGTGAKLPSRFTLDP